LKFEEEKATASASDSIPATGISAADPNAYITAVNITSATAITSVQQQQQQLFIAPQQWPILS
jgi:hypothetical protein